MVVLLFIVSKHKNVIIIYFNQNEIQYPHVPLNSIPIYHNVTMI